MANERIQNLHDVSEKTEKRQVSVLVWGLISVICFIMWWTIFSSIMGRL
ncbi:hypothetical protein SAMN04515674_108162 [Pseudarcicella hirudinis]|uniref:Uncharacterized protein n=1 Tax=Pseudarcicella hirudinis TaxID=1079859 RepID=A0A1I5V213_9BACT|nr:hypothetical protein [Pseudarcicella hirudinis]SFQ01519.1 hypothetical protein SAMN04515674_108162 [Pseudarcicella hirudinis]